MGHLTSRFGNVSPQGKVIGWEISSIAVGVEESSPMFAKMNYCYCTRMRNSVQTQISQDSGKRSNLQTHKEAMDSIIEGLIKMLC